MLPTEKIKSKGDNFYFLRACVYCQYRNQYFMQDNLEVTTSTNVQLSFELASLGDRILATLIDFGFQIVYMIAIGLIFGIGFGNMNEHPLIITAFSLPILFYDFLLELLFNGQTIGKRLMNIQVVRLDGDRATVTNYFLRWVIRLFEITTLGGGLAMFSILATDHRQRIGDLAAGTTVVKVAKRHSLAETSFSDIAQMEGYEPHYAEASQLEGSDAEVIREVLALFGKNSKGLQRFELAREARMRICNRIALQSNDDDVTVLNRLINDYNYYESR